jgi:hypothetical protein
MTKQVVRDDASASSAEFSVLSGSNRFDAVDLEQMRLLGRLTPGQRIQVMLDARELAVGLIRGRLRRQYPHLSLREINLKVLEEIDRAKRMPPRP